MKPLKPVKKMRFLRSFRKCYFLIEAYKFREGKILVERLFGIILMLLLVATLTFTFNIQPVKSTWTGTVYIRADGSIDPPDAPITTYDTITYTLTDNITSSADGIVVERDNLIIDGAGCQLQGSGGYVEYAGIRLEGRKNITIKNMHIQTFYYGVYLFGSSDNIIIGNNVTTNSWDGITLNYSSSNYISGNNIANNRCGITLRESSNNSILGNNITANNGSGIQIHYSSNNCIFRNKITNNHGGIYLTHFSTNNTVLENSMKNNECGISLFDSSTANKIYHNDFISNAQQVYVEFLSWATWDNGYPSGGNFWSNYNGTDFYSGINQNETGRDGIGDTPYVLCFNNTDSYPLMYPGGFILIGINKTISNYTCPTFTALNFTFTLNSTMHVSIRIVTNNQGYYYLYVKWDGSVPTSENYDDYNGGGSPFCSKKGLPPGRYYFILYHESIKGSTFNVTVYGYYPIHNLNTSLSYPTIQGAINAPETLDGHTIGIDEGIYYEHVVVDKELSLIGENKETTIIDGKETWTCIQVTSDNVKIVNLTVQNAICGIELYDSHNCSLIGNVAKNNYYGLILEYSGGNYLRNNTLYDNAENFCCYFPRVPYYIESYINDIDTSNTVNGHPIYYWVNQHNREVPYDAGTVVVVNSTNIKVTNLTLKHNRHGVLFFNSSNSIIKGVKSADNFVGILLINSFNCTLCENEVMNNSHNGFRIEDSQDIALIGNLVSENEEAGIDICGSNDVRILDNIATNNDYGLIISGSLNCPASQNCIVVGNSLSNNVRYGIYFHKSKNTTIYHNNFINNGQHVHLYKSYNNSWDNGCPSGGNYWNDYSDADLYHGPFQNETGSDSIGDTPYTIDANNTDRYPLIAPISVFDAGTWNGIAYSVDVVSNSTVSDFHFNPHEGPFLRFNVTGDDGTLGFCRVAIPKSLLWVEDGWTVSVGNEPVNYTIIPYENYTYLYFTYNHSTQTVTIQGTGVIPEFPSSIALLGFLMLITIPLIFIKKKSNR